MSDALTVLVIDDDGTTRELLELLLSAQGWRVVSAASGDEALAWVQASHAPDVILSDLQMPGLCGTPMARALRGALAGPVNIIAMTATATAATPEGFDDLLVKPFPPEELRRRYETLCAGVASEHASEKETAEEVIDGKTLERLQGSMPAAQVAALYDFALNDAVERVRKMEAAAAAGDDATYRQQAHALKGSCGMIGALQLRDLAHRAEVEGSGDVPLTASNRSAELTAAIDRIRHMLKRFFPGRN